MFDARGGYAESVDPAVDLRRAGANVAAPRCLVRALRDADGPVLFAHADLSGMSLFEEASYGVCLRQTVPWDKPEFPYVLFLTIFL